jgi:hypothetical protein
LGALIRVEYFRPAISRQSLVLSVETEARVHRVRHPPRQSQRATAIAAAPSLLATLLVGLLGGWPRYRAADWGSRVVEIIQSFPSAPGIDIRQAGFPKGWD